MRAKRGRVECGINTITIADVLEILEKQDNKCVYTGKDFVWEYSNNYKPSIDRIDSTKGYTKDNIQLVCVIANQAKSDLTHTEFLDMVKIIYDKNF